MFAHNTSIAPPLTITNRIAAAYWVTPEALVGRTVRLLWEGEELSWYLGIVDSYDAASGQHHVEYADGDKGWVHMGAESMRLLHHAAEALQPVCHEILMAQARKMEAAVVQLLAQAEVRESVQEGKKRGLSVQQQRQQQLMLELKHDGGFSCVVESA